MSKRSTTAILTATLLTATAVAGGNEGRTVRGETVILNGAKVTSWANIAPNGQIMQVGVTLPMAAIENTPDKMEMVQVNFPAEVQRATFVNHVSLDWMPGGHEPEGRYNTPHFDVHYFTLDKAAARAIDCKDLTTLPVNQVPQGWAPAVPPNVPPQAVCVPTMGFHSLPLSEFTAPGQFQPGLFDKVMITGDYGGKIVFIEPMVTKKAFMEKKSFTLPVPALHSLGRATQVPTRFNAVYNPRTNAYDLILSDFRTVK